MADQRFHVRTGPYTLARIAEASDCVLGTGAQADMKIVDVAPLDQAGAGQLSFLDNPKYKAAFAASKAGACICSSDMAANAPAGMALLVSKNPYRSYAQAATLFYPWPSAGHISDKASIHPTASVGPDCIIEDFAVIGPGVEVGAGCWIGANATLSHCVLGTRVRIHTGVRIGQDGFGFAMGPQGHLPVPQLGRVIIEDFVNIGANSCIDRGAGPDTVLGMGSVIDNLVQIGHNVKLGRGCVIVSQTGISGSTVLGDFVVLGGQVGVSGHLHIGMGARVAAQSGITKDIPAGEEWVGFPAAPRRAYWKMQAKLKKLLLKSATTSNSKD